MPEEQCHVMWIFFLVLLFFTFIRHVFWHASPKWKISSLGTKNWTVELILQPLKYREAGNLRGDMAFRKYLREPTDLSKKLQFGNKITSWIKMHCFHATFPLHEHPLSFWVENDDAEGLHFTRGIVCCIPRYDSFPPTYCVICSGHRDCRVH